MFNFVSDNRYRLKKLFINRDEDAEDEPITDEVIYYNLVEAINLHYEVIR